MERCDYIFRNACVIDGSGEPSFYADVAVRSDRIVEVGETGGITAKNEIDLKGLALAPGFIDAHTHDDAAVLHNPAMDSKISQGVTTVITGNCGISLAPLQLQTPPPPPLDLLGNAVDFRFDSFSAYFTALRKFPPAVNVLSLVGHSSLRVRVMRDAYDRPANKREIEEMQALLNKAMQDGASGFSTGLIYPTNKAAPIEEVIELAKVAAQSDGLYTTHLRNEDDYVEDAVDEALEIGRAAKIATVVSHHKCAGRKNHGKSTLTLSKIREASKCQEVSLDVYPYTAASTILLPELIAKAEKVMLAWSLPHPEYAGKYLEDITKELKEPLATVIDQLSPAGAIYFLMNEADVRRIISYKDTMIGSDGLPNDLHPHPRLWGTFPRVLGHYARDIGLLSIEEAVRKMTSLPAEKFGIFNRGKISVDSYADIVVFDPKTIIDGATFDEPQKSAEGIEYVMVNGTLVLSPETDRPSLSGRPLTRNR